MQYEVNSLIGCSMAARDGIIGKVEDFYFDDECWTIRYLIVKTGNWLSGRKVLISTNGLTKASWKTGLLPVNLTIEQIQNSLEFDESKFIHPQTDKIIHVEHDIRFE